MSVAQYLKPGKLSFDLVIMDEVGSARFVRSSASRPFAAVTCHLRHGHQRRVFSAADMRTRSIARPLGIAGRSPTLQVLKAHGYQGVPQVGACGYRIDIAIRHPVKPSVCLCGVECDGATYHSASSVRERDRPRQEILEKYGWKLYRAILITNE
jgi:hypothetical protein